MMSDAVYQVIRKATAISPSDRYQNAGQMKKALMEAFSKPDPSSNWLVFGILGILGVVVIVLLLFFLF